MSEQRPPMVGRYHLLLDYECPDASVRVFRIRADGADAEAVEQHVHHHTNQIYVALEGEAVIINEGVETNLVPFQALTVTRGSMHGARSARGEAIVMNISVPPLQPDDQVAVHPDLPRADLRMPSGESDIVD